MGREEGEGREEEVLVGGGEGREAVGGKKGVKLLGSGRGQKRRGFGTTASMVVLEIEGDWEGVSVVTGGQLRRVYLGWQCIRDGGEWKH